MHLENIWWLESGDPFDVGDDYGLDEALEMEGLFGDIVKTVSKVAAAPVNAVAKALPRPVRGVARVALDPVGFAARGALKEAAGGGRRPMRRPAKRGLLVGPMGRAMAQAKERKAPPRRKRRASPNETAIKLLGAQRILETIKPKVRARSGGAVESGPSQAQVKLLAAAVGKQLSPQLDQINKRLALAQTQRQATSEHLAINNQKAFRTKVLKDLMRISGCLPESHPTRQRIRKVGLMSGLV